MGFAVGIDLGTTFSAAAVADSDGVRMVGLAHDRVAIPSVVAPGQDRVLVGEETSTISATKPWNVAREFKRRFGDPTPMLVDGHAVTPQALTGHLLGWILRRVEELEGESAADVVLTHPATWGEYKLDLLRTTASEQGIVAPRLVPEPTAAAIHYHARQRVAVGDTIAVYDLGGGTFDVTILERTADGYRLRGRAGGLDRVGGLDLDDVLFGIVTDAIGIGLDALDQDDPDAQRAVARLREECTRAKIGLSYDTRVIVPVLLPGLVTEVLIQRAEFERAIAPLIDETIAATSDVVDSAQIDSLDAALLVGGSSRVPIIGQRLAQTFGVDVVVDSHPKHAIALGAAASADPSAAFGFEAATGDPVGPSSDSSPDEISPEVQELPSTTVTIRVDMIAADLSRRYVLVLNGPLGGKRIDLAEGSTVIGRVDDRAVVGLVNRLISRRHLRFDREGPTVTVTDLGSTNGTSIDGVQLGQRPVHVEPGEIVDAAGTLLMIDGPGARLEPVQSLVDAWMLPEPRGSTGFAGRLRRRSSTQDWIEAVRDRLPDLLDLAARAQRARRFERPSGAILSSWERSMPERVTPVSTVPGSVVIGWADLESLFDFGVLSRAHERDVDEVRTILAATFVDRTVPLVIPVGAQTTALLHRGPEADAMIRSMLSELQLTQRGVTTELVDEPSGSGLELRVGPSSDQAPPPVPGLSIGRVLLDPEPSTIPPGAATITMVDDGAVYRSGDGQAISFVPATLHT